MSTVGEVVRTVPTKGDLKRMAAQTELSAPEGRGGKAEFYYLKAQELIATGQSASDAFQALADANEVSVANIKAGYARYAKENGHPSTPGGSGRGRRSSSGGTARAAIAVPKDLAPLLDSFKKQVKTLRSDLDSLEADVDRLTAFASAQEERANHAVNEARSKAVQDIQRMASELATG